MSLKELIIFISEHYRLILACMISDLLLGVFLISFFALIFTLISRFWGQKYQPQVPILCICLMFLASNLCCLSSNKQSFYTLYTLALYLTTLFALILCIFLCVNLKRKKTIYLKGSVNLKEFIKQSSKSDIIIVVVKIVRAFLLAGCILLFLNYDSPAVLDYVDQSFISPLFNSIEMYHKCIIYVFKLTVWLQKGRIGPQPLPPNLIQIVRKTLRDRFFF